MLESHNSIYLRYIVQLYNQLLDAVIKWSHDLICEQALDYKLCHIAEQLIFLSCIKSCLFKMFDVKIFCQKISFTDSNLAKQFVQYLNSFALNLVNNNKTFYIKLMSKEAINWYYT